MGQKQGKPRQAKKRASIREDIRHQNTQAKAPTETLHFAWHPRESVNGDRYLTPLYFNIQVLTRYMYDSRFECQFASDTYGTVSGAGFGIPFGINKNGSVIAWLGDLEKTLPIRERFYWLVENKESEAELASEFFDAQIGAVFTEPPSVVRCLNSLARFNMAFHRKFGVHPYRDRSIEERIQEVRRYKRIVLNNADDFKRFVSELNEITNENTNNVELRRLLASNAVKVESGAKGNKLLELAYKNLLADSENRIAPFFYLYDLRLWADHSMGDEPLNRIAAALNVDSENYEHLLDALVRRMTQAADELFQLTQ